MKKAVLAVYCSALFLSLAACGVPGAVRAPAEETLPAATQSAPAAETDSPSGEQAQAAAADAAALLTACLYTDSGECTVWRTDYTGDGQDDWVFRKTGEGLRESWMFIAGGAIPPEPDIFYDISAAGGLKIWYSEALGQMVIEKFYSSGTAMDAYAPYDGEVHDYAASMRSEWEVPFDAHTVDGSPATEEEYEEKLDSMRLAELSGGYTVSAATGLFLELPEGAYEQVCEALLGLPFVERSELLDGDGGTEYVLYCNGGLTGPEGLDTAYYEAGCELSVHSEQIGYWGYLAAVIGRDGHVEFMSFDEADTLVRSDRVQASSSLLPGMEQDGDYFLSIYSDGLERAADGCYAYAELTDIVKYTNAEVLELLSGLEDYEYSNTDGREEIAYYDGFLVREAGEDFWRSYAPSDAPYMEVVSSGTVFVPDSAEFIDDLSSLLLGINHEVTSLEQMFSVDLDGYEHRYDPIEVIATVSGGRITCINMYYTP